MRRGRTTLRLSVGCRKVGGLDDLAGVVQWIDELPGELDLNVAGPRESEVPGIYERALGFLSELFGCAKWRVEGCSPGPVDCRDIPTKEVD